MNSLPQIKQNPNYMAWIIFILACWWGYYLYSTGLDITGPFIFGDESTYFTFARTLFQNKNISAYTQYGPLYPKIISFMFYIKDTIVTYHFIRILNILIFLSTSIPAFLLAKELFSSFYLRALLPLTVIFTPFSPFVYLVWAEPLYISIFYFTCFSLLQFIKHPTLIKSILLGSLLSSLYYTKPGAGLVAQIAGCITLFVYGLGTPQTRKNCILSFITILITFLVNLPWFLHYYHLNVSLVGYPGATSDLSWNLSNHGYIYLISKIFLSLFYQFSYVFIGTFGLFPLLVVLTVTKWPYLNTNEKMLAGFAILYTLGLISLSAIGMASYTVLDYRMPNGRYFTVVIPLLISLSLYFIFKPIKSENKYESKFLYIAVLLSTFIAIFASPLYTRNPVAYNSMPELSPIIYIIDKGLVIWRDAVVEPSLSLRLCVPIIFAAFAMIIIFIRKSKLLSILTSLFILYGMIFATQKEQYYLYTSARSQSSLNDVYIYLKTNKINLNEVKFDKKMEPGNPQFMSPFWMEQNPTYKTSEDALLHNNTSPYYFITDEKLPLQIVFSSHPYFLYRT